MKRLSFCLFVIVCLACWNQLSASEQEDMDSLLHKVAGHRQGIVVQDGEGVKLKVYLSSDEIASNGQHYYRWWTGNFLYSFDPKELTGEKGVEPLPYGYRYDEEKMYVYNYLTEEESVACDFTLQPGEQFTTPNGMSWKVVGRRTEVFKSAYSHQTDYRNNHVILSLQSLDGTVKDEWVQYIGSLHFPIQTWGRTDVKRSRTAFFNFGTTDDKLVYFNFAEDPLFGQYLDVEPLPDANLPEYCTEDYTVTAGDDSLNIKVNCYTWFTRHYCYTYRDSNTFDIHSIELGPYLDGGNGTPSFDLTFPITSSFDDYNVIYNGETLSASIDIPKALNKVQQRFDLSGRRITQPTKGIYIRQGRKVVK